MKHRWLMVGMLGLMVLAQIWMTGPAMGQTGSITPTRSEVAGLPTYAPPEITFIEESVVDLRPWLPPVGHQKMNDCMAWAIAYAAKSYAEARDQGWRPDHPSRIFSPTFVYNQINDGEDEGSHFVAAVVLMRDQGAATLATAPYRPHDYTSQPSERARQEAAAFRVHDGNLIETRIGIRRALQRRKVVVFGANVNPTFFGGRFDVYTDAIFRRDHEQRRPNQPHGKHAMVIVGYDDAKSAFLVQNSWGTNWGQRGYCWIGYDLFDRINFQDQDAQGNPVFCNWALTLIDVEEPITYDESGMPQPQPLDTSTLRAAGFSDFIRYDTNLQKFLYGFSIELRGQLEALEQVEHVTWTWTNPLGRPQSLTARNAPNRFGIRSATTLNPMTVTGEVVYKDGSTTTVQHEVRGPVPHADFRDAQIVFDHWFYDMVAGTEQPDYMWEMSLDYPLNEREDIVKVVWDWGQMSTYEETSVTYQGAHEGVVADRRPVGFAAQPDTINVEITYADGGVKRLQHRPEFNAEIIREPSIDAEIREVARDHLGRMHYAITLQLKRPRKLDYEIDRVIYEVDAHASTERLISPETLKGCPVTVMTHRDFRVKATIEYTDGRRQTLERWVELGDETGYADPNRVELLAYDMYIGSFPDPNWRVTWMLVGDQNRMADIERVTFTYPGAEDEPEVFEGELLKFLLSTRYLMRHVDTNGPTQVDVLVRFRDGAESRLQLAHTPRTPVNESLGIDVQMADEANFFLNNEHQQVYSYNASLVGPVAQLVQIAEVEWFHQVAGRQLRTELPHGVMGMPGSYMLASVATEPFELVARVRDQFGDERYLTAQITPGISQLYRAPLSLDIIESFNRFDDAHQPQWHATIRVAGDHTLLERIEEVTYTHRTLHADTASEPVVRSGNDAMYVVTSFPKEVTASVRLDDGETYVLNGSIRTLDRRSAEPLFLRLNALVTMDHRGFIHWVQLDGWRSIFKHIQTIRYEAGDVVRELTFGPDDPYQHNTDIPYGQADTVTARIVLDDGSVINLEQPLVEVGNVPFGWTWEQGRYWGDGKWEVHTRLTGPLPMLAEISQRVHFALDGFAASFEDLPSYPVHRKSILLEPGEYTVRPPQFQVEVRGDIGKLEGKTILVEDRPLERTESLQLIVERAPVRSPDGDAGEWHMRVRGPERDMVQITRVRYTWWQDEQPQQVTIDRRWGEFHDGFEYRRFSPDRPVVNATVTLNDGRVIQLSTVGHLIRPMR